MLRWDSEKSQPLGAGFFRIHRRALFRAGLGVSFASQSLGVPELDHREATWTFVHFASSLVTSCEYLGWFCARSRRSRCCAGGRMSECSSAELDRAIESDVGVLSQRARQRVIIRGEGAPLRTAGQRTSVCRGAPRLSRRRGETALTSPDSPRALQRLP